jgi:hypothetical protein
VVDACKIKKKHSLGMDLPAYVYRTPPRVNPFVDRFRAAVLINPFGLRFAIVFSGIENGAKNF